MEYDSAQLLLNFHNWELKFSNFFFFLMKLDKREDKFFAKILGFSELRNLNSYVLRILNDTIMMDSNLKYSNAEYLSGF